MTITHVIVFVQRPRKNVFLMELRNGVNQSVVVYARTQDVAQEGCPVTLKAVIVYNGVIHFYKS